MALILDTDEKTELSEIRAVTHSSLDDALEDRTVKSWSITGNNKIKIILNEAVEVIEEEEEPHD